MGAGKERCHGSDSLVLWSHHGDLPTQQPCNGSNHVNHINTRGATQDHSAFDHGCFYALHDDALIKSGFFTDQQLNERTQQRLAALADFRHKLEETQGERESLNLSALVDG